jgi:hypothetical protein
LRLKFKRGLAAVHLCPGGRRRPCPLSRGGVDVAVAIAIGVDISVAVGVAVAVGIIVGVAVAVGIAPNVAVGVAMLAMLLGVDVPTPSSPSIASKAPKRSAVPRSSSSSPCGPPLMHARYSSASMEVRSTGTELPSLRCSSEVGETGVASTPFEA